MGRTRARWTDGREFAFGWAYIIIDDVVYRHSITIVQGEMLPRLAVRLSVRLSCVLVDLVTVN